LIVVSRRRTSITALFPYTTLFRSGDRVIALGKKVVPEAWDAVGEGVGFFKCGAEAGPAFVRFLERVIEESQGLNEYEDALHMLVDRKSTRLNSSHVKISYAVFCLK